MESRMRRTDLPMEFRREQGRDIYFSDKGAVRDLLSTKVPTAVLLRFPGDEKFPLTHTRALIAFPAEDYSRLYRNCVHPDNLLAEINNTVYEAAAVPDFRDDYALSPWRPEDYLDRSRRNSYLNREVRIHYIIMNSSMNVSGVVIRVYRTAERKSEREALEVYHFNLLSEDRVEILWENHPNTKRLARFEALRDKEFGLQWEVGEVVKRKLVRFCT